MEEIRKQLQCRQCGGPLYPPILKCKKGESVCRVCREQYKRCPLCNHKFTNEINEPLEALAKVPCFPCDKCNTSLTVSDLRVHFDKCIAKKVQETTCPIQKCMWTGETDKIVDHWLSKKLSLRPFVQDNICCTKLNKYSYFCNIVQAHDSNFFFKSMCNEGKFFWALQYVGNLNEVENYSYEIEIFNPKRLECRFTLSSYCQGIDLSNKDLFKEGVSIFTPVELLKLYLNEDDAMLYNLRVHKVDQDEMEKRSKKVNKLLEKYAKK